MAVDNSSSQVLLLDEINRHSTRMFEHLSDACSEWTVNLNHWCIDSGYSVEEDMVHCACGHAIRYEYSIKNKINGETITPIGSCCILRFDNKYFNHEIHLAKRLTILRKKILSGEKILTSKEFSRSIFDWFIEYDIITSDELGIIKAVQKLIKAKDCPTQKQLNACKAIFNSKIRPSIINFDKIISDEIY